MDFAYEIPGFSRFRVNLSRQLGKNKLVIRLIPYYVRKIPVLNATEDISFHGLMNSMKEDVFGVGTLPYLQGGVTFNGCVEDPTLGDRIYKPGHPDADENGYIRASNVNAMVDMADAILAQRAYEANLAVINITKSMALKAVEIGR